MREIKLLVNSDLFGIRDVYQSQMCFVSYTKWHIDMDGYKEIVLAKINKLRALRILITKLIIRGTIPFNAEETTLTAVPMLPS